MLNFHTHTKYFAHRGLHEGPDSEAPENSLAAFRRAVSHGYGIELDIRFTRDRKVVVFHDNTLERICGVPERADHFTLKELKKFRLGRSKERIPLLTDVLKTVAGRVPLIVEFKAETVPEAIRLCRTAAPLLDAYSGEYVIESFHPMILYWYRHFRPLVSRGQLCTDFLRTHAKGHCWQFALLETQLTNLLTRPNFVAYDHRFAKKPAFRFWSHFSTPVGWTFRSPEELRRDGKYFRYYIMEHAMSSD